MASAASLPAYLARLKLEGTDLTPSERRVLRLIAQGYNQVEAADRLGVSFETTRKQMKLARARLGARTNCHAVAIAVSLDLI